MVCVGGRLLTCFRNRYRINAELGESNSVVSLEFRVDTHFLYHVRVWEVRERQTDREQVQKQGRLDSWGLWSRRRFFLRCDKGWAGWPPKEHAWRCNLIEYNPLDCYHVRLLLYMNFSFQHWLTITKFYLLLVISLYKQGIHLQPVARDANNGCHDTVLSSDNGLIAKPSLTIVLFFISPLLLGHSTCICIFFPFSNKACVSP